MKLYVVTYFGGEYEDAYQYVIGIFDDKYKAEALKLDVEKQIKKDLEAPEPFPEEEYNVLLEAGDLDSSKIEEYSMWNSCLSNTRNFAFVSIEEFELNKKRNV